jgi:hypothetical protein
MVLISLGTLGNIAQLFQQLQMQQTPILPILQLVVNICFLVVLNTQATKEYCSR